MRRFALALSSLRVRLALLVVAAILPALLLSFYDFAERRREVTAAAYADALRVARATAADQDQLIESTRQFLYALATHPQVRSLHPATCSATLKSLLSPSFTNLGVATLDGNVFCSALHMSGPVNIADRLYFRHTVQTRAFSVGEFQIGRITGQPAINVGYPLLDGSDQVRAVIFAALDISEISATIAKTELPPDTTLTVLDSNGTILAHRPEPERWVGQRIPESALFRAIKMARGEGTVQVTGLDGRRRLFGFATMPSAGGAGGIYVSVGFPVEVVFGPATRQLGRFAVSLGIATLGMLIITWLTANALILRPVDAMVRAVRRLSQGDLAARTGETTHVGELGQLAHAFDEMANILERSSTQLKEAEAKYRALVEQSLAGIYLIAGDRFIYVNAGLARIFGYTPEEITSKVTPSGLVHPEDRPLVNQNLRARLEGHVGNLQYQFRGLRKDGATIHCESFGRRIVYNGESAILGTLLDVTERERAEDARVAREAAEAANRAKSEFLSRMSHELRTPLNAILGFGQLLEMDATTPEQRESVEQILKAGRHLLDLINEILDIARIEAGRLSLSIEPVALQELAEECLDLIRPSAAQRRIVLELPTALDHLIVMADRQRLKQVLLNLLSNAVKFNTEGGRVALSCEHRPQGRLRVSVTDTGAGIATESLPKLFRAFERLGAGQTGVEGTGLGLALSKSLMEAMNGTIGVESTAGRGSTFWVELPLVEETAPDVEIEKPAAAAVDGSTPPRTASTVLYIEDNLSNLKLLERVMARRPEVRLLTAMQGRLGLDLARQHRPDLILLDLDLPDLKGDEILRMLRNDATTDHIPVVMLTATATPGEINRLLKSGARGYLTKPFDVTALLKLIDEIVVEETRHA